MCRQARPTARFAGVAEGDPSAHGDQPHPWAGGRLVAVGALRLVAVAQRRPLHRSLERSTRHPILVIGTRFDPNTPFPAPVVPRAGSATRFC